MHYQYVRSRDTSFKPLTRPFLGFVINPKYDRSRHASLKVLTRSFSEVVLTPELKFEIRTISSYAGEFINQYSWAENVTSFLDLKITKG